ncbi:MAG: HAMP domain-containing protein, partial [Lachnospiraceae bacterium]|nr:HAMP domain-containing protein [Lachnospiraceae bacterium]
MKIGVKGLSTLGLIFITFLAAIQYVFLNNVPDSVSTFCFVFITNVIGVLIIFLFKIKKVFKIEKRTLKKGAFFAFLLTGFNLFVLLGSRGMDSVVISSTVSLYFVFVTPLLILLRKKVNFFSSVATVLAIIALILMFGGDTTALFQSSKVIYLIVADVFFAAYVVGVSILGEGEDSSLLAFSQMCFSSVFALIGWVIQAAMGKTTLSIPTDMKFWISAIFIGIFIRAVYGLLQISCQKHVSAISASLIFSAEIIITIMMDPIMSKILHTQHTPATRYQIVGAILLIIATLVVDDNIMSRLGYSGMNEPSVSKKMVVNTLTFSMVTLAVSTIISLSAIYFIRNSAVSGSAKLGADASKISSEAMVKEREHSIVLQAEDKAKLAEQKLLLYASSMDYASSYASSLYKRAGEYPKRDVELAKEENAGIWAMQLGFANESVNYDDVKAESQMLGNMEDIFEPIVRQAENVLSVYMGTETGLMISYDTYSELAAGDGNQYYDFYESEWYQLGKETGYSVFTDAYWDSYGRGLTITCVSPFYNERGEFAGCVAMDILMEDMNRTMVNDGIVNPNVATLIDDEGNIIVGKDIDTKEGTEFNIFDEASDNVLKEVGKEILEKKDGVMSTGTGKDRVYVAFATIDYTQWTLCILSPVSTVLEPSYKIRDSIDANTDSVVASVLRGVLNTIQNLLVLTAIILLLVTMTAGVFSRRITDPLKRLTKDVMEISGGNLERRTKVDTNDEIGELAMSFNNMTDSLQKYISDLKDATAKEQRIASELAVATDIQASMLPTNFEAFTKGREFNLFASMDPAKEVGGDFYDFFMIDDDHLCIFIADVSGKGVPAALFMMSSKTVLANNAMQGKSPAKILEDSNNAICANNKQDMFVT